MQMHFPWTPSLKSRASRIQNGTCKFRHVQALATSRNLCLLSQRGSFRNASCLAGHLLPAPGQVPALASTPLPAMGEGSPPGFTELTAETASDFPWDERDERDEQP